jgi:hypothetical protein
MASMGMASENSAKMYEEIIRQHQIEKSIKKK